MSSAPPVRSAVAPAVSLRGVSKRYVRWNNPSERLLMPLRQYLRPKRSTNGASREFTAVADVTVDIAAGDCIGIIGRNGAGKSTLLQMIAGTLQPTTGAITLRGRVAALLELGSGFNPDFTGRENVYLNASILGLSKRDIDRKYEAIVAYADIPDFMEQPVRIYSTGMAVRLAFAVCVHVDADILIIDEALAVGDARFQFKCHATLDQMRAEGRTIIFVSHDTNAVKRMCNEAILLEQGQLLYRGQPNDVVNLYTKLVTSPHGIEGLRQELEALQEAERQPPPARSSSGTAPPIALPDAGNELSGAIAGSLLAEERAHQQVSDKEYAYGGESGEITSVVVTDEHDAPRLSFVTGSTFRVRFRCAAKTDIPDPIYALTIKDVRGQEIFGTNTYFQNQTPASVPADGQVDIMFQVQLNVLPGVYFISVGWVRLVNGDVVVIHRRYDVLRIDVMPRDRSFGIAYCPTTIQVQPCSNES